MNALRRLSVRLRRFKMFFVAALSVLAVYQTSQLWFVSITNRNFFLDFFDSGTNGGDASAIAEGLRVLTKPYRIVSGAGDGFFSVKYGGLNEADEKEYADEVLSALLGRGAFSSSAETGLDDGGLSELLNRPAYVLDYAAAIPAEALAECLGQPGGVLTLNGVTDFYRIAIHPPSGEETSAHVYFFGGDTRKHFTVSPADRNGTDFVREVLSAAGDRRRHIFSSGFFVAEYPSAAIPSVTYTNPYASVYGDRLMSRIRSCVETLFDNPATIIESTGADGALMFSNANTVVRYNQRDVLEYANYRAREGDEQDLISDFAAAVAFINADEYVVNEYSLAGYETDENQSVFRFDYIVNGYPLTSFTEWPELSEEDYVIEVVVEHGVAVRYKKLVYNFKNAE